MNRVLRKPLLRFLTSYYLTPCSTASPRSWPAATGYRSAVWSVAVAGAVLYAAYLCVGLKGLLFLWLFSELLFFFINKTRCDAFNRQLTHSKSSSLEIRTHFHKFLRSLRHLDPMEHLKDWFIEEAFGNLPEENVLDLIAYAFAFRERDRTHPDVDFEQLFSELMERFYSQTGAAPKRGYQPNVRFRSHLWENLRVAHYPLSLYCLMEALSIPLSTGGLESMCVGWVFAAVMALLGFLCFNDRRGRYFVKDSQNGCRCPILFIHGLGIGPIIYLPFIWLLCQLGHPIVVLEMPHVSVRLCFETPSIDILVDHIEDILQRHSIQNCVVVGHSYGTFIASRLNALSPQRVTGLCMIDPVCCVMHNPKLIRTFIYGTLDWKSLTSWANYGMLAFFSRDPCVAASVCRQFRWTDLNLWPEDIPEKTLLVLSEGDVLVPVDDVKRVFGHSKAQMITHPLHCHGSFLADLQWQRSIVRHIRETFGTC